MMKQQRNLLLLALILFVAAMAVWITLRRAADEGQAVSGGHNVSSEGRSTKVGPSTASAGIRTAPAMLRARLNVLRWPDNVVASDSTLTLMGDVRASISSLRPGEFVVEANGSDVVVLLVQEAGYEEVEVRLGPADTDAPRDIALRPLSGLAFQILDTASSPIAGVSAEVWSCSIDGPYGILGPNGLGDLQIVATVRPIRRRIGTFVSGLDGFVLVRQDELPAFGTLEIDVNCDQGIGRGEYLLPTDDLVGEPVIVKPADSIFVTVSTDAGPVSDVSLRFGIPDVEAPIDGPIPVSWRGSSETSNDGTARFSSAVFPGCVGLSESATDLEIVPESADVIWTNAGRARLISTAGEHRIQVRRVVRVSGRVVTAFEGVAVPVSGAQVAIEGVDQSGQSVRRTIKAGPLGEFGFKYLGAETATIWAERAGFSSSRRVELTNQSVSSPLELELTVALDSTVLCGRVLAVDGGAPPMGQLVIYKRSALNGKFERLYQGGWSNSGAFAVAVTKQPDSDFVLFAKSQEENLFGQVAVAEPGKPVLIQLAGGCSQVVKLDGASRWTRYRLDCEQVIDLERQSVLPWESVVCVGAKDGAVTVGLPSPETGLIRITCRIETPDTLTAPVVEPIIVPACEGVIKLQLPALRSLSGRVVGNVPVGEMFATLLSSGGERSDVRVAPSGSFSFVGVRESNYVLIVYTADGKRAKVLNQTNIDVSGDMADMVIRCD